LNEHGLHMMNSSPTVPSEIYEKWLGIPQSLCPPDYYTLLGLERGEPDLALIKSAADERIRRIRPKCFKHRELGTQLLNEIARACVCLTSSLAKAEYDQALDSGTTRFFETSTTGARLRETRWSEHDLAQLLAAAEAEQLGESPALAEEAAVPEELDELPLPDEMTREESPAAAVTPTRPSPHKRAEPAAPSRQQPITCPNCHQLTAPPEQWDPVPVSIDAAGNLTSPVCRIHQRRTRLFLHLDIDAKPFGEHFPVPNLVLTSQGASLLAGAVAVVGFAACVLLQLITGQNLLIPMFVLGLLGPIAAAAAWWIFRPSISSAEEAAWLLVVPELLSTKASAEHFNFVAGLARASATWWEQRWPLDHQASTSLMERRVQQETAKKRHRIVRRCLGLARGFASEGRVPHAAVGWLYRLLIVDQLSLDDSGGQSSSVLEEVLNDCLGKTLPLACLDLAIHHSPLLAHARPLLWRRFLVRFYEKCLERGHTANEVAALTNDSAAISKLLARMSLSAAEAVAFLAVVPRTCHNGLDKIGGATVFEFTSHKQLIRLLEWPDLLALARDEVLALRMSGFYFQGVRYVTKPKIFVSREKHGYHLHVGHRAFFYHLDPGDLGGRVVAWSHLYFQKILPSVQEELAREISPSRLQDTRSVAMKCPHCQRMFGGVLTLSLVLFVARVLAL